MRVAATTGAALIATTVLAATNGARGAFGAVGTRGAGGAALTVQEPARSQGLIVIGPDVGVYARCRTLGHAGLRVGQRRLTCAVRLPPGALSEGRAVPGRRCRGRVRLSPMRRSTSSAEPACAAAGPAATLRRVGGHLRQERHRAVPARTRRLRTKCITDGQREALGVDLSRVGVRCQFGPPLRGSLRRFRGAILLRPSQRV
jgi:hypothetical protein